MAEQALELSDIVFSWQSGAPPVLDVDSFSLPVGARVFLKGPSGSGKTTLLNLIGGVTVPEAGRVKVLGTEISSLTSAKRDGFRADHIGFIFQMFNLVPYLSLIENVCLPCRFSIKRRQRALAKSPSLEAEAHRLLSQMGLNDTELAKASVTKLSVGQQQRVAAARALIGAPQIIVADEATSALDTKSQNAFMDLLFKEVDDAGATLLFVSHDDTLEPRFENSIALENLNRAVPKTPEGKAQ